MSEEALSWIVAIMIMIAGVWLTILTYIVISAKRRSHAELVEEIKKTLEEEKDEAHITPLLNEMLETEVNRERKVRIKTIKRKAKKIDVSDIAELMGELDSIVDDSISELKEREELGKALEEKIVEIENKAHHERIAAEAAEETVKTAEPETDVPEPVPSVQLVPEADAQETTSAPEKVEPTSENTPPQ